MRHAVLRLLAHHPLVRVDGLIHSAGSTPHGDRVTVRLPRLCRALGPCARIEGSHVRRRRGWRRLAPHGAEALLQKVVADAAVLLRRRHNLPNHAALVDRKGDRHVGRPQQIVRVDQNGPPHLLPLHEEAGPVGGLLLDDPDHLYAADVLEALGRVVPPGHVSPTACSPRCKDV